MRASGSHDPRNGMPVARLRPVPSETAGKAPTATVPQRRWYHTLELPGGVVTPGEYDLRPALLRVPLPESLEGRRCLDVGTHDGFWAFEMEKRGAREVVAIDLDDPERYDYARPAPIITESVRAQTAERLEGFEIARRALGSQVQRRDMSVYELSPAGVGEFDFAVIGTLLLHLRDPVGALSAIDRVLRGDLLVNDVVSVSLTALRPRTPAAKLMAEPGLPFWWLPNVRGLRQLVVSAGYDVVASHGPYRVQLGSGWVRERLQRGNPLATRARQLMLRRGVPHAWVLARTRGSTPRMSAPE
jgi:SAM-dependent methyltransferase